MIELSRVFPDGARTMSRGFLIILLKFESPIPLGFGKGIFTFMFYFSRDYKRLKKTQFYEIVKVALQAYTATKQDKARS